MYTGIAARFLSVRAARALIVGMGAEPPAIFLGNPRESVLIGGGMMSITMVTVDVGNPEAMVTGNNTSIYAMR